MYHFQNLAILPALLQTAVLSLLSATIPLSSAMAATLLAIRSDSTIIENPDIPTIQSAKSIHVLAFTSKGELLVNLSEGSFTMKEWDGIFEAAERICCGEERDEDKMDDGEQDTGMIGFVRSVMEEKVSKDLAWKA